MTVSMHRVQAVLKRPTTVPDLIFQGQAVVDAMTANSWFSAPAPSLATVQAAIKRLQDAEAAALARTVGLKQIRNDARAALVGLLNQLRAYVEAIAEENPDSAAAIIESAAMSVKGPGKATKPSLAVFQGRVSGSVRLVAKAAAKLAQYEWQLSPDGGKSWLDLPQTLQAKTTVSALAPGSTYRFRMRAVTRRGRGDWCDPVSDVVK
jgi:cell pole-organizing protein PopZ